MTRADTAVTVSDVAASVVLPETVRFLVIVSDLLKVTAEFTDCAVTVFVLR